MSPRPGTDHGPDSPTPAGRLPRRGGLALIVAFATAVAVVPASQALASGHGTAGAMARTAVSTALAASRGGRGIAEDGGQRGPASRGGLGGAESIPAANPRSDHSWWPFAAALHGVEIVETKDGGIQTVTFQRGVVQSVSGTSLTVLSRDGVSQSWTLDAASAVWVGGHRRDAKRIRVGSYVGTWGAGTATSPTAKFVVVTWSPRTEPRTAPKATPTPTPTSTPASGSV